MDSSTSDFIIQRALRYGLHSCSYCQAVLVDLTSLVHPGTEDDEVDGQGSYEPERNSLEDKTILLYYRNMLFQQFNFSQDVISAAAPSCPLFELLDKHADGYACPINVDESSTRWFYGPGDIHQSYHLRIPEDLISSCSHLDSYFDSHGPPIDPRVNEDGLFARARELLDDCLSEHQKCKSTGTPPSRLIDVRQCNARLVDIESVDDPTWAALSYCWGGPQEAQTTHLNIEDRYREIVVEDLPLTIRDAIHVCRQMNIPYLWVDSLCIVQSNGGQRAGESDKDRELRKMAGIFSGSVLTISASCASSAKEGFLHDRRAWPPGFAIPVRVNDKYDIAQFISPSRYESPKMDMEPVDSRAWIFQEQKLSNRNLNFRTWTMHWRCQTWSCCFSQNDHLLPMFYETCCNFGSGWGGLVEEYSGRDLSVVQDRPIAFAAVAESWANHTDGVTSSDYLAGLWKPSLVDDLIWAVNDQKKTTIKLQGPSWSWTTVPRRVSFSSWRGLTSTVTIISAEVDLANPNLVFGAAKSGRIRLQGLITRTSRYLSAFKKDDDERFVCGYDRETEPSEVFLLELGWWFYVRVGLMLRMTDKATEFVRVGNFVERIYAGCARLKELPDPCMWHEGLICPCSRGNPAVSCGWTCDKEERVIDIV